MKFKKKCCLISGGDRFDTVSSRIGLGDLLVKLNSSAFIKVHRSNVVNEKYIKSYDISVNQLTVGEETISASRSLKLGLLKRLKKSRQILLFNGFKFRKEYLLWSLNFFSTLSALHSVFYYCPFFFKCFESRSNLFRWIVIITGISIRNL